MIVHGRFHIFDLAREMLRLGHDVTVFTNYSRASAERFGIPGRRIRSCPVHGFVNRAARRLAPGCAYGLLERAGNSVFGRWATRAVLRRTDWDVVLSMSGVAEELFRRLEPRRVLRVLHRGSAHVLAQRRLLDEEADRAGAWIDRPSDWIIAREQREYALADAIHVLSTFAERTFLEASVPADKIYQLQLGVQVDHFRAAPEALDARCRRLLEGAPISVLNVGTFCLRKGALDFLPIIEALANDGFTFRFVGPVAADAVPLRRRLAGRAEFVGKRPQDELPAHYARGDLFLLPTIEDGFAAVLTQALAAGLPLIATPNCGGPELVHDGEQGWIVPIRCPEAIIHRLRWCAAHRAELARMARTCRDSALAHDWTETARQAESNIRLALSRRPDRAAPGRTP